MYTKSKKNGIIKKDFINTDHGMGTFILGGYHG
jgi:hypothetical protein